MKQPRKVLKAFLLLGISCAFSGCSAGSLPWKPHSNEQVQSAHRADAADHATIADSAKSSESAPLTAETAQSAKSAQEATNAVFAQTAGSATNANFATTAGSYMGTILPNQINDQLLDVQMSPRTAFQTKGVLDSYSAANLFGFPADKLAGTVPAGNLPSNLVYTQLNQIGKSQLPALDGTLLDIDANRLVQGTIPLGVLPSNVVLATGNVLPALDGSLLTKLSASQLSGTVGAPNLPSNVVYSSGGQLPALDGSQLTGVVSRVSKMTTTQRLALVSPAEGEQVFDTTGHIMMVYNGSRWVEIGAPPIGTIQAWHKSKTNTPALSWGWVECDGKTLSDPESPYDNQVISDLNNTGNFLRGSAASGTFQTETAIGSLVGDAWSVQISNGDSFVTGSVRAYSAAGQGTYTQTFAGVRPRNMSVVWIVRVK